MFASWIGGVRLDSGCSGASFFGTGGANYSSMRYTGTLGRHRMGSVRFCSPWHSPAIYRKGRVSWVNVVASLWVFILSALTWRPRPDLGLRVVRSRVRAGMIAWGIYEFRAERVNLGITRFAHHSPLLLFDVMDRLGRSAILIIYDDPSISPTHRIWEKLAPRIGGTRTCMEAQHEHPAQRNDLTPRSNARCGAKNHQRAALRSRHLPTNLGEAMQYDPIPDSRPIPLLILAPEPGDLFYYRVHNQRVVFFVPERPANFAAELWAEVTIPRTGPPRPIRLDQDERQIQPIGRMIHATDSQSSHSPTGDLRRWGALRHAG